MNTLESYRPKTATVRQRLDRYWAIFVASLHLFAGEFIRASSPGLNVTCASSWMSSKFQQETQEAFSDLRTAA
jgi:hypothetical protein